MRLIPRLTVFLSWFLLASWSARADTFVRDDIITDPAPDRFSVCFDHGCQSLSQAALTQGQWDTLRALFPLPERNAADERQRIGEAIALLETFAGMATGTATEKGGNLQGLGEPGQMDCIDESTNTTLYLTLLQKYGLMRLHRVEDRATRGWLVFGWPHTTAVIQEIASGTLWAVDSWFLDNGKPPLILTLDQWESGWQPKP